MEDERKTNKEFKEVVMKMIVGKKLKTEDGDSTKSSEDDDVTVNESISSRSRIKGYVPKLDFPKFDGNGVRMWLKKCNQYFKLCKIANDPKVDLTSLNMIDKVENWISSYLAIRRHVDWNEFIHDRCFCKI